MMLEMVEVGEYLRVIVKVVMVGLQLHQVGDIEVLPEYIIRH
jgi:hypothetical protein